MGNLNSLRDWGHARDYVEVQWLMLQQDKPDDYCISTGIQHSVRQFIEWTALELGITVSFQGEGVDEIALVTAISGDNAPSLKVNDIIVRIDKRYFRPLEVETLLGDASKAKRNLGWSPKISAKEMCSEMVKEDLKIAKKLAFLKLHGHNSSISLD